MARYDLIDYKILRGEAFTAARSATLASGSTASVAIENPSDSGKTIVIATQKVITNSAASGTYYRSPDVSDGTVTGASSDLVGSTRSTIATVTEDASFSNSISAVDFPISSSGTNSAGLIDRPPIALRPGESFAIEVTSNSSSNQILMLITYYETERTVNK